MKRLATGVGVGALVTACVVFQGVSPDAPHESTVSPSEARQELKENASIPGTSWAVDPKTDKVIVTADKTVKGDDLEQLKEVTEELGEAVELEKSSKIIRPLVSGGDAILSSERCSAGINVLLAGSPFLVTAGHCGAKGSAWREKSGTPIGSMVEKSFPGDDYALIKYNSGSYPSTVNMYPGSAKFFVIGDPATGMQVKRSGSTTGVHEGRITGLNATVNYGTGYSVSGLVQTDVCAEPGDSGGPLFSGGMALGLLSGGSGNCQTGGLTFYQPLNEVANKYKLTLPQ